MSKVLLGLATGAAVMGGLAALVFANEALALPALYAMGAGGYIVASKRWQRLVPGILAIVVGIFALIGALNLTIGRSGFDASWFHGHAAGLAVTASMMVASAPLYHHWIDLQLWLAVLTAIMIGCIVIVALSVGETLDNHASGAAIAVGILSLITAAPWVALQRQDG